MLWSHFHPLTRPRFSDQNCFLLIPVVPSAFSLLGPEARPEPSNPPRRLSSAGAACCGARSLSHLGGMYFDIDDILAEEERVSAVTTIEAFSLGFLDPSCEHEDLPANTKVRANRAGPRPPCAPRERIARDFTRWEAWMEYTRGQLRPIRVSVQRQLTAVLSRRLAGSRRPVDRSSSPFGWP